MYRELHREYPTVATLPSRMDHPAVCLNYNRCRAESRVWLYDFRCVDCAQSHDPTCDDLVWS